VAKRDPFKLVLAALVIWSLVPLVVLLGGSGSFSGAYGFQISDQMQYLAFVREAGDHGLISNLFDVRADPHVFLHPLFIFSGLAHRLGASVQLALLAWQPVAVAVLFVGFAAFVRRMLGRTPAAALALVLALFFLTPAAALTAWLGGSPSLRFGSLLMGLELFPAGYGWSGSAGTIAVGLMPIFLLGAERLLDQARRAPGRSALPYALGTGAAGLLVSWLHPWQGLTLLVIVLALAAWSRFDRRFLVLAVPVAATAAPLAYFALLTRTSSSWSQFSHPNTHPHVGTWFFLGLAPALLALPGVPGRHLDVGARVLRLWPVATLVVYFALQSSWFYQALAGLSLPLAVLAVQGARSARLPRLAVAGACLALTVPGMVFVVSEFVRTRSDHFLAPGERRALAYLDGAPREGAVLAPQRLGQAVPGFTDRRTWVGNYQWTPNYDQRRLRAEALFDGRLGGGESRVLVRESRAAFLLGDCRSRADLTAVLGPIISHVRRFGCATVYELRGPGFHAQSTAASSDGRDSPSE
jgi:hypothetical protein